MKKFPLAFWTANAMEIFERMAWYGFFAVSSLYITGPISEGGLGFSHEDRGVLQGVVTFFLYLFPVVTGGLADRYGFKKMLFASFLVMVPSYFLLGQFKTFPTFFIAFMFVALGAAMFKPVIVGTIAKVTTKENSSIGFGIFYMMVNIGGFVGPIVAGMVRAISWNYVFIASAGWIAVNFLFVTLFFKEPKLEGEKKDIRTFKQVMKDMVEVLGNERFFFFVFGILFLLVMGSKFTASNVITWGQIVGILTCWIILNTLFDLFIARKDSKRWYLTKMKLGDWRFGLFLLLMSGFWTAFNQIFYTLPNFIEDFVDTNDVMIFLVNAFSVIGLRELGESIYSSMAKTGQMNPEYMINLNAGAIIFFQVFVSTLVAKMKPFTTIFWGVLITVVSFSVMIFGKTGGTVLLGIFIFSFGEMMASPKSKEYTGSIAPAGKVALYMGYFYWCVALGNLFGGILSGQFYGYFARDLRRPDLLWGSFAILSLVSAGLIYAYDRLVIKKIKS